MVVTRDEKKPWEQIEGESDLWFDRFERFRLAGPKRSVLSIYNQEREKAGKSGTITRSPGSWDDAVAKWQWRERSIAWDDEQRQQREQQWKDRQDQERTRAWELSERLYNRANEMLDESLPENFTQRDIAVIAKTAAEIGRQASGLDEKNKDDASIEELLIKAGVPQDAVLPITQQFTAILAAVLAGSSQKHSAESTEAGQITKTE